VRGVSGDGELVEFRLRGARRAGLDLLALVIGSEGMLAVITGVTVKLVPKRRWPAASWPLRRRRSGREAVAAIIAAGIIPAGLEMMDRPATRMVEPFVKAGYDLDAASILLVESTARRPRSRRDRAHDRGAQQGGRQAHRRVGSETERLKF